MPLDSVIMDSITCKEKRKYHLKFQGSGPAQLKFQGSGPAQMKEHVLIIKKKSKMSFFHKNYCTDRELLGHTLIIVW